MRESSLVPTNLLNSPQVAPLLPELKLLILALWSSPYMSCAGCGLVPLRPFSSTLGLAPESTASGLELLEKAGLIATDATTGEIFVCSWFRFHHFKSPASYRILLSEIERIESGALRELVRSRIPDAPAFSKSPSAAPAPATPARTTDRICERTGVIIKDGQDDERLTAMISKHGVEKIQSQADRIKADGGRPFVSSIYSLLSRPAERQPIMDGERVYSPVIERV